MATLLLKTDCKYSFVQRTEVTVIFDLYSATTLQQLRQIAALA